MGETEFDRIERLFKEAAALAAAERGAFLDRSCAGDERLRADVLTLLRSHDEADLARFLEEPAMVDEPGGGAVGVRRDPAALVGTFVGPYRVERFVGGGGMGDVYLAVREQPFKQHVALKIIRSGAPEVLRRFDFERQVLASLSHPNIANLLDGDVTSDGRPYFAMEFVNGMPVTRHAERHGLSIRDRLALFRDVCAAVMYAHSNLVIHRDLKPANILVTSDGVVKLLDFGIAKILNPNLSDVAAPVTQTQFRMLTPDYASPEQVLGEPLSTASDVYSLGVVLYELLTGRRPYSLAGRTAAEVERVVCEVDPARPSTATAKSDASAGHPGEGGSAAGMASAHGHPMAPDRLARALRGDLDNIVMTALRKEPSRRYQSVGLLLRDIDNYLTGQPVAAHKDSRVYRVTKFIRRNTLETVLAALIVSLLAGFALYSGMQARKLERERDRARAEMETTDQVSAFVVGLFENANPTLARGDVVTVREVLDAGRERAEVELADKPLVQAELFSVIGNSYLGLGQSAIAADLLLRATEMRRGVPGLEDRFASDLLSLGQINNTINRSDDAQQYLQEYIDLQGARLGPRHPDVLMASMHLMSSQHMTSPAVAADSMMALWQALEQRIDDLEPGEAAVVMGYVSDIQLSRGNFAEAERVMRGALSIVERDMGKVNAAYADMLNRLAWTVIEQRKTEEALEVAREAVSINETLYVEGHRDLAAAYSVLGEALSLSGSYDEAAEMLMRDIDMRRRLYGELEDTVARTWRMLGWNEERRGNPAQARAYIGKGAEILESLFGKDYVFARQYRLDIADVYFREGAFADAEAIYLDTYNLFVRARGQADRYTRSVARDLARLYEASGDALRAEEFAAHGQPPG